MNKNKHVIVKSLWIGKLKPINYLSIKSFIDTGHEFHLYAYDNIDPLPMGVILKDANEILDKKDIFTHNGKIYAPFADIFRYKLLYQEGGWWVDTDMVALNTFPRYDTPIICSAYEGKSKGIVASNFVMGFPKNHILLKVLIEKAISIIQKNVKNKNIDQYLSLGPPLIQEIIESDKNFTDFLAPYYHFAPIPFYHTHKELVYKKRDLSHEIKKMMRYFTIPNYYKSRNPSKYCFGVHLWNFMWKEINQNDSFAKTCLYEQFKTKYLGDV